MNNSDFPLIDEIVKHIEIPESFYILAEKRYKDISEWISKSDSCGRYNPYIFPQGSFRYGTVIRPIEAEEPYDLDLSCKFQENILKSTHTQKQVKLLLGEEIENYRIFRHIEENKEEKHRCWRLSYKDNLKFHLDMVPCIPEDDNTKRVINEAMLKYGIENQLADILSKLAVSITDNRHYSYDQISIDWQKSNPQGYAKWFESRMKLATVLLEKQVLAAKVKTIDEIPVYRWKTPLQHCIQILKRHRDVMFKDYPDMKPISIIITTLAAKAYNGESDLKEAMQNILNNMGSFVQTKKPYVPNPVNPDEDFADKWYIEDGIKKQLKANFEKWLQQAQIAFKRLLSSNNKSFISEQIMKSYSVSLDDQILQKYYETSGPTIIVKSKEHKITEQPPKPWGCAY